MSLIPSRHGVGRPSAISCPPAGVHLVAVLAVALPLLFAPAVTRCDDEAYCAWTRARAREDAGLLLSPRLIVQAQRFPAGNASSLGPLVADREQVRVGVSISAVDLVRGVQLERVAEYDCRAHAASEALQDLTRGGTDLAALPAYRAQAAYLEAHRTEWEAILAHARDQLGAGEATRLELEELRRLVGALERQAVLARGEERRLAGALAASPRLPLERAAESLVAAAVDVERQSGRLRALDGLEFKVSAGVIPSRRETNWYALVELSVAMDGLRQSARREETERARAEELRRTRSELPARAVEVRRAARAALDQARAQLGIVERELAGLRATRAALERSPAVAAEHARALFAVESISLDADQVFLTSWASALAELAGEGARPGPEGAP